jgi:hypothetical protein
MFVTSVVDREEGVTRCWDIETDAEGEVVIYEISEIGDTGFMSSVTLPHEAAVRVAWAIIGQRELVL